MSILPGVSTARKPGTGGIVGSKPGNRGQGNRGQTERSPFFSPLVAHISNPYFSKPGTDGTFSMFRQLKLVNVRLPPVFTVPSFPMALAIGVHWHTTFP